MTSFINLPATYHYDYIGEWALYCDLKILGWFDTKQEAEDFARQHYANEETK